jgi:predicted metal-dependent hydrolase
MSWDWSTGELAAGLDCYRRGQFFEAHEHWELVWLKCDEPDKTFLQSLIQVSAAFHHLGRGNPVGARSMLTRALARLERYPDRFGGVNLAELRQSLRTWLQALDEGVARPDYPRMVGAQETIAARDHLTEN